MAEIPRFDNEEEEREFWSTHDAAERVDWSGSKRVTFPNLRPSVKTISLRLPEAMLDELKLLAHQLDVPYQSLIKVFLAERLQRELGTSESIVPDTADR